MFRLTRVIVRLHSEPFGFSSVITYCSGGCWSVWSGGWPYTDMNEILKKISRNFPSNISWNYENMYQEMFLVTFLEIMKTCIKKCS
jgi:hypothetical protein